MTETQVRALALAALSLWTRRCINGPDDDADRAFLREVSQVVAETASE